MVDYVYDNPTARPQESPHWEALDHREGDRCIENLDELQQVFTSDLKNDSLSSRLALWSCLLGYCEALCTSKNRRYSIYPIPIDALERLVASEFTPPPITADTTHRSAAQNVANWVWGKVVSKSNVKDEQHANSLYSVLRGNIDGKSVDCFGAALVTVIGLRQVGLEESILTLSEDHAYESHYESSSSESSSAATKDDASVLLCTCEVAIPGNTKAQKAKRGKEIAETFRKSTLTPETSWLYMGMAPIQCRTAPLILAAALANLNCMIEIKGKMEVNSEPLLVVKRELLWILKDAGHIDKFPFALCELGWSEEHCTSTRGDTMQSIPDLASVPVTAIEALYHEAIVCSQTHYDDRQVYPYCYIGYYHKDGGQQEGQEYRLGIALNYFSQAARVASRYQYEWGDTLQLTKVMTKISEFIVHEILTCNGTARAWQNEATYAIEAIRWLLAFYDALLVWEERTNDRFLPILRADHKTGIAKTFSLVPQDVRTKAFHMAAAGNLQSNRLQGSLGTALQKTKVTISDLELTLVSEGRRQRKRKGI